MLVVGVVAADLGAARCAVKAGLGVGAEGLFQPVQHGGVTGGFRAVSAGAQQYREARRAAWTPSDSSCFHTGMDFIMDLPPDRQILFYFVWAIQPASNPIVKDLSGKNHVLLLHLNEKLQKSPPGLSGGDAK